MLEIGPFVGKSALIFDLDGTLVETNQIHSSAFQKTFRQYGISAFDYNRFTGHKTEDVVGSVFAEAGIAADASVVRDATEHKQRVAQKALTTDLVTVPGAIAFLERVARKGFRLAIGTGASSRGTEICLEAAGLQPFFEIVVTGDDVTRGKPAPDIFLNAAAQLDVPKEACLVFEDSPSGLLAARAAGLDVLILKSAIPVFSDEYGDIVFFDYQDLSDQIDHSDRSR